MNDADLLDRLHDLRADLDANGTDVDSITLMRARRQLLARAVGPQVVARRRRRRWPRVAIAAGAAGILTAGVGVSQVTGLFDSGATPAAAAALNQAAEITLTTKDPVVLPTQYLEITETRRDLMVWYADGKHVSARYFTTTTNTRWIPGDPTRQSVLVAGCSSTPQPGDFLDAQSAAFVAEQTANYGPRQCSPITSRGVGPSLGDARVTSPWMAPNAAFLAGLPRDPHDLFERVRDGAAPVDTNTVEDVMMGRVTDLLRTGTVPADLRAALFRAAALIPDVDVTSDAVTMDGHTGVAVARAVARTNVRQELVFDPHTGLVVGQRTVLLEADGTLPAGFVTGSSYQSQQVVDSAP